MAFYGTLGHVKFIQGRKVAQFIVEVPTELAMNALHSMGGIPRPDEPFSVAVARIFDQSSHGSHADVLPNTVAADDTPAGREAGSYDDE